MGDESNTTPSAPGPVLTPMEQTELSNIEEQMKDNRSSYWTDESAQSRFRELIERPQPAPLPAPVEHDDGDDAPLDQNVVKAASAAYGITEHQAEFGVMQCRVLDQAFGSEAPIINAVVEGLPNALRREMAREVSSVVGTRQPNADSDQVATFLKSDVGKILADRWGADLPRRLGEALYREQRFQARLSDADLHGWKHFFWSGLDANGRAAVLDRLTA
jgi:hypothetical protein